MIVRAVAEPVVMLKPGCVLTWALAALIVVLTVTPEHTKTVGPPTQAA